jgi:hypothetical protein
MTSRACLKENISYSLNDNSFFSSNYKQARNKFLKAVYETGSHIESFKHPNPGPDGEPMFVDLAYFGSHSNTDILVVISGTHGVEGYAGSAIQTALLQEGFTSTLPSNLNLIMIHALNPYGMAYTRRTTENNIDLNRNFIDHSQMPPGNTPYEMFANVIAPSSISFWSEIKSWLKLFWFKLTSGDIALQTAISKGQYAYPTGLFYGGDHNTWSNDMIRSIAKRYLHDANKVVIIDIHTGLGSYGNAEVILNSPMNSPEYKRAIDIWGPSLAKTTVTGESVSVHLESTLKLAFPKMLPDPEVTAVSLEFGTLSPMDVFKALRAENWLYHHGSIDHTNEKERKNCLLKAFYPNDEKWRASVLEKGKKVIEGAIMYLSPN